MKNYTFDGIYQGKVDELTDAFLEAENRAPNIGEENSISAEAKQYATEFMENYVEWQIEQGHEQRRREQES
jgi:hypothetical protein